MTNRTVMILAFAAAVLFAIAGILSLANGSTGTGGLNLVAAALFVVVGVIRLRGGRRGGRGGDGPPRR